MRGKDIWHNVHAPAGAAIDQINVFQHDGVKLGVPELQIGERNDALTLQSVTAPNHAAPSIDAAD